MSYFDITVQPGTAIEILQKVRAEQKSVFALEHMLGYHIKELEELRPHKNNIEFIAESDYTEKPDLIDLYYWTERIGHIETSIRKNEEMLVRIYDRLYSQILFKIIEGEELNPLDIFFYHSKKYIKKIQSGEMTFRKLVEYYDWEAERFIDMD